MAFHLGAADTDGVLLALVRGILGKDALDVAITLRLCGRPNFARSRIFGRSGSLAASIIGWRGRQPGATRLTPDIRRALGWWLTFLDCVVPRLVKVGPADAPPLVWTDGAHEPGEAMPTSCGAVLYDPRDGALLCFGFEIAPPAPQRVGCLPRARLAS